MSDNEVSKESSSESGRELSKDCERRSSVRSTSESSGDCEDWSAAASIGANCGKWITVAALYGEPGCLTILGWKSCRSGHSKVCTIRLVGGNLLEARVWL